MPLYDGQAPFVEHYAHTNSYLILMRKEDFFSPLTRLMGFALTAPNIDQSAEVTIPEPDFQAGQVIAFQRTVRPAAPTRYTWTLGFPDGNFIETPVGNIAGNSLSNCTRDFYLLYLCADSPCKSHFIALAKSTLGAIEPGDWVTFGDDPAGIEATAPLSQRQPELYVYVRQKQQQDLANPLYSIGITIPDCSANCGCPNLDGAYAGDGGANPLYSVTDNQFGSGTDDTIPIGVIPAANSIWRILIEGNLSIVSHTDDPTWALVGDSGLAVRLDGAWSVAVDEAGAEITDEIRAIFKGGSYFYAIGNSNVVLRSVDGITWETLTSPATGTTDWWDGDYDRSTGLVYLGGEDGANGVAYVLDGEAFTDITSLVNPGANGVNSVAVLGDDHVAFGLDNGQMREHQAASTAATGNLYNTVLTGSTSPVIVILGNLHRTAVGTGTEIRVRDILTNRDFSTAPVLAGGAAAGAITHGVMGEMRGRMWPGANDFFFTTDAGEILHLAGCKACV